MSRTFRRLLLFLLFSAFIMVSCIKVENIFSPDDYSEGYVPMGIANFHVINRDLTAAAKAVFVTGDYAYVACGDSGLQIMDVRIPNRATLVGIVTNNINDAYDVYVEGDYAYIADRNIGLRVVDVENPAASYVIRTLWLGPCLQIYITNQQAYLACHTNGVAVYDVSDPQNPSEIFSHDTSTTTSAVLPTSETLYTANNGLSLYAISNTNISFSDQLTFGDDPLALAKKDQYIFAGGSNAVYVVDLANPFGVRKRWDAVRSSDNFFLNGNYLYISTGEEGLKIADISDPLNPYIAKTIQTGGTIMDAHMYDIYVFLADSEQGLIILSR